jgi:hypothetical protein
MRTRYERFAKNRGNECAAGDVRAEQVWVYREGVRT